MRAMPMTTQITATDLAEFFRLKTRTNILGGINDDQVADLLNMMEADRYADKEPIFYSGDPASAIYIVLRGAVRLDFGDEMHPLSQIEFLPGDCFGETSVIGIQPHSAGAVARGDVTLLKLTTSTLHSLYESDTKLFAMLLLNIAREASRRLHHTDNLFLDYTKTCSAQSLH